MRAIKHGSILTFVVMNDKERKEVDKLLLDMKTFKIPEEIQYPIIIRLDTTRLSQANA